MWLCTVIRDSRVFFGCQVACYCRPSPSVRTGKDVHLVLHVAGIFVTAPGLGVSIACVRVPGDGMFELQQLQTRCCSVRLNVATRPLCFGAECHTAVEAGACLGRGRRRALCSGRWLRTLQVFTDRFFLDCNWEWGKGFSPEGHDVFAARKKKP